MAKIYIIIWIGFVLLFTAACGTDSEAEIIDDVTKQQTDTSNDIRLQSNNTDQNKQRNLLDAQLASYADEAGYYISHTATLLEHLAPYFEQENLSKADLNDVLQTLSNIRKASQSFVHLDRPVSFDGFHNVLLSTLVEVDALQRIFSDMREPPHPLQIQNARVYFEKATMSHKLMEKEFLTLTEEFGLH